MPIHPTAIVDPRARIAETADIGPYCIIGAEVEIGARTRLMANIYMEGPTWIGEDNIFFPFSTIGVASQDLKYKGERAETRIGHRNRIREFVTIHRGTAGGGLVTRIGNDNLLMTYAHVAHDCRIGDHVILGNSVALAGHVIIEDWVDVGAVQRRASVLPHRPARLHRPYSVIKQDIMPYSLTSVQAAKSASSAPTASAWSGAASRSTSIEVAADRLAPADARRISIPRRPSSAFAPKCRRAPKWTNCSNSSASSERGVVK